MFFLVKVKIKKYPRRQGRTFVVDAPKPDVAKNALAMWLDDQAVKDGVISHLVDMDAKILATDRLGVKEIL